MVHKDYFKPSNVRGRHAYGARFNDILDEIAESLGTPVTVYPQIDDEYVLIKPKKEGGGGTAPSPPKGYPSYL